MRLRDFLLLPLALVVSALLLLPVWLVAALALILGVALLLSWLT